MASPEVEHRYLNIIEGVKRTVKIPVAVKLNPYFSAMGNMAYRMHKAGADVVMTASSLYKNGIPYLKTMNRELLDWMYMMGFDTIESFKGTMSQQRISNPTAYERANYIKILEGVK